jgi:hypothetical protein
MDTIGGSDPGIQYPESISSSGQPGQPPRDDSPGMIRRLVRRLPRIVLLWAVVSVPLIYLVDRLIEPTYESSSTIRIEPSPDLFGRSATVEPTAFEAYLKTQRALILSDRVLEAAIVYVVGLPGYPTNFPIIKDSTDPKADVRKRLGVNVIPGTYLIQVAFSSPNAIEAAELVNQVVSAFEQENRQYNTGMNQLLVKNYQSYLEKLEGDIREKQNEMLGLADTIERQVAKAEKPRPEEHNVARPTSRVGELRITFIRDELTSLKDMRDSVRRKLEQLQFESQKGGAPRVEVVGAASASKTPQSDSRMLWRVILPLAVLVVLLGTVLVLEAGFQTRRPAVRDHNLPVN